MSDTPLLSNTSSNNGIIINRRRVNNFTNRVNTIRTRNGTGIDQSRNQDVIGPVTNSHRRNPNDLMNFCRTRLILKQRTNGCRPQSMFRSLLRLNVKRITRNFTHSRPGELITNNQDVSRTGLLNSHLNNRTMITHRRHSTGAHLITLNSHLKRLETKQIGRNRRTSRNRPLL